MLNIYIIFLIFLTIESVLTYKYVNHHHNLLEEFYQGFTIVFFIFTLFIILYSFGVLDVTFTNNGFSISI